MKHERLDHFARCISHLLCPPCVAVGGIMLATVAQPSAKGWWCAAVYVTLAVLAPILVLLWLFQRGQVSDLDVTQRREWPKPFIAALCGATVAWGGLQAVGAPVLLIQFAAAHMAVLATILLITVSWKISVHSASAAGVATLIFSMLGAHVFAFTPVVLVAWSRLYLKRHTFMQVLAGGILGMIVFMLLFSTG